MTIDTSPIKRSCPSESSVRRRNASRQMRGAIRGSKMHGEKRRLGALADRQHMMLAAGCAKVQRIGFRCDLFQRPDLAVELRRLVKIADTELDAANSGYPAVCHA